MLKVVTLLSTLRDPTQVLGPKPPLRGGFGPALETTYILFKLPYNYLLKPLANGLLMGKILAAAPAAIPIRIDPNDKPYLAGILNEIDKSDQSYCKNLLKLTDLSKRCFDNVWTLAYN